MNGLLGSIDDPKTAGLLSLGLRLMSTPGKFTQALGQSGLGAMGDMQQAQQMQDQRKRQALQEQMLMMQLQQQQEQAAAQKAAEQKRSDFLGDASGQYGPARPFDLAQAMQAGMPIEAIKLMMAQGQGPAPMNVAPGGAIVDPRTGKPIYQAPFKPDPAPKADSPFAKINPGDYTPQSLAAYQASGDVSKLRRAVPVGGGGGPASPAPVKLSAAAEKAELDKAKTGRQSEQMIAAINEARSLLGRSPTASGIGAGMDWLGRQVGVSSESAQTAAKLETLSGWMVANVPRMEGPQSNFDIQNYQTMAAKVGDRMVPVPERLAALKTLEDLHRKYAEINGTPVAPAPSRNVDTSLGVPKVKFLGFEE